MKRSELLFTAVKPPLDYLALVFAALGAYSIRYLPMVQNIRPVVFDLPFKNYISLVVGIALLWLGIFALAGLYTIGGTKRLREELGRIFVACSAGLALVLAVMVFSRFLFDSRFIILATWFLAIIFVSIERIFIRTGQKFSYKFGFGVHRVAIIGNSQVAKDLTEEFTKHKSLGYKIVAQFLNFDNQTASQLQQMAETNAIDEIIEINPNANTEQTIDLINFINEYHLDFKYTADLLGTQLTNIEVTSYAGMPIVEVKKTRLDGWGRINKRIFDIFGSIILIIIVSPIMLITALAIKIDSSGPTLFRYKRMGQFGKPFNYFKFRSMIKDAHHYRFDPEFLAKQRNLREGSPMIKFKNDPRVTRVGKFLRRFSIDELPELFLVLIGKMSLVGPRPHEIEEVKKYQRHHKKVLTIKPGITGLAQISGRSDLNFEEEIKLDTFYIENWSLGLDLQILFKTPLAVLKRRKAE
ncbi:MAG: sugar transferase [Patescibacteria group bacterium]|jgi:exopolysaccharide biosynthesis polyprenyl glycosylphosphotransferase